MKIPHVDTWHYDEDDRLGFMAPDLADCFEIADADGVWERVPASFRIPAPKPHCYPFDAVTEEGVYFYALASEREDATVLADEIVARAKADYKKRTDYAQDLYGSFKSALGTSFSFHDLEDIYGDALYEEGFESELPPELLVFEESQSVPKELLETLEKLTGLVEQQQATSDRITGLTDKIVAATEKITEAIVGIDASAEYARQTAEAVVHYAMTENDAAAERGELPRWPPYEGETPELDFVDATAPPPVSSPAPPPASAKTAQTKPASAKPAKKKPGRVLPKATPDTSSAEKAERLRAAREEAKLRLATTIRGGDGAPQPTPTEKEMRSQICKDVFWFSHAFNDKDIKGSWSQLYNIFGSAIGDRQFADKAREYQTMRQQQKGGSGTGLIDYAADHGHLPELYVFGTAFFNALKS